MTLAVRHTTGPERPLPRDATRRVVIEAVRPEIDGGRFPIKRTVGEKIAVWADIFADGHDVLATVLRYRHVPSGDDDVRSQDWEETPMRLVDNDRWTGRFIPVQIGRYEYTIEAWVDVFLSWRAAFAKRVEAGQVSDGDLLEGAALLRAVAARAARNGQHGGVDRSAGSAARDAEWLGEQAAALKAGGNIASRARVALDDALLDIASQYPDRSRATAYERTLSVLADRERACFGAWYEMFPRSASPVPGRSATLREAEARVPEIAAMGFDVLYLPPIHPIGTTGRKGPGNILPAGPSDPGSPWAIGSPAGGHKAVDPGLGTLDDFNRFVAAARKSGLEIALDLAYQCSPDHPYVREHPEWFRRRIDGTIKYAENPPKKYEDIFPFDFDTLNWQPLWQELKSIVLFWIDHGVHIFRVDNPHTKPFGFWEWLIREVREEHPDTIFLSEAFTRPKVMKRLAKLGFTQSYTYFTWRNTKHELMEYFTELTQTEMSPESSVPALEVTSLSSTYSNSAVTLGGRYFLKVFRRLEPGINPDVEIGLAHHRRNSHREIERRAPAGRGTRARACKPVIPGEQIGAFASTAASIPRTEENLAGPIQRACHPSA